MAAATRGRGGRGRVKVSQVQPPRERQPKAPKSIEELSTYLFSLNEENLSTYGGMFSDMVLGFSQNEEKMNSIVDLIFDTTTKSRENASLGAKICQKIVTLQETDAEGKKALRNAFRKYLFVKFQGEYKNKEATRKVSIERWLSIFSFLCEVFRYIRVNDQPINVIGKAILSTMEWLLKIDDIDSDEIECVCEHLKNVGKVLEGINNEAMASVIAHLRMQIISNSSSCKIRCIALEVIEFRAMGWSDRNNELDGFYIDAIADATANDELSSINS